MHRSAGLLNTDEQLLTAGRSAAARLLFMAGVPLSLLSNLIVAVESRSNGLKRLIPFRCRLCRYALTIIADSTHSPKRVYIFLLSLFESVLWFGYVEIRFQLFTVLPFNLF
jgi:hypothetical protein